MAERRFMAIDVGLIRDSKIGASISLAEDGLDGCGILIMWRFWSISMATIVQSCSEEFEAEASAYAEVLDEG